MLKIGINHVTKFQNHDIQDMYGFGKVICVKYLCFLNKNMSTERSGLLIVQIAVENGPAAFGSSMP